MYKIIFALNEKVIGLFLKKQRVECDGNSSERYN